jgi:hypothetical protein
MITALISTGPTQSIRNILTQHAWNVCLHMNPEIPWLDRDSALILGQRVLRHMQRGLYGRSDDVHSRVFILVPELCPEGLWHYHGFAWINSARSTKKLMRNGPEWFTKCVHGFIRKGGCWIPKHLGGAAEMNLDRISPSALVQPLTDPPEPVWYAEKNWLHDGKEELVCLDGHVTR